MKPSFSVPVLLDGYLKLSHFGTPNLIYLGSIIDEYEWGIDVEALHQVIHNNRPTVYSKTTRYVFCNTATGGQAPVARIL